jgi:hypothetical protein
MREAFIRLHRRLRPCPWRSALMRDIPFQQSIYRASADFADRRMTHRSPLRRAKEGWRRWVWFCGTTGLPVGLHGSMERSFLRGTWGCLFYCMPFYILDVCPENRNESNGDNIIKLWLQFIPIFGALHSRLRKGHTIKKTSPCSSYASFLRKRS